MSQAEETQQQVGIQEVCISLTSVHFNSNQCHEAITNNGDNKGVVRPKALRLLCYVSR
jgi:hypothetical protein